jgi:hypothetical protein
MDNVDKLTSGRVRIGTGDQFSVKKVSDEKDAQPEFDITIVPHKTTLEELLSRLSQLNIKFVERKDLINVTWGKDTFHDIEDLKDLDDLLEKAVALSELSGAGINVDPKVIDQLTPEKAGNSVYIGTLKELNRSGIKVDGTIIEWLGLKTADDPAYMEKFKELKIRFDAGSKNEFLLYLSKVPKAFCEALDQVYVHDMHQDTVAAWYETGTNRIEINSKFSGGVGSADARNCLHELAHNWDYNQSVVQRKMGVENLYKKVSWSFKETSPGHPETSWGHRDEFHRHANADEFISEYARTSPLEDFADMFAHYVVAGHAMRQKIREQLSAGKLKLAAKYIYLKYLTPFKGMEYQLEMKDDKPLMIQELAKSISDNRIDVPAEVMRVIDRARFEAVQLER